MDSGGLQGGRDQTNLPVITWPKVEQVILLCTLLCYNDNIYISPSVPFSEGVYGLKKCCCHTRVRCCWSGHSLKCLCRKWWWQECKCCCVVLTREVVFAYCVRSSFCPDIHTISEKLQLLLSLQQERRILSFCFRCTFKKFLLFCGWL